MFIHVVFILEGIEHLGYIDSFSRTAALNQIQMIHLIRMSQMEYLRTVPSVV